jgi:hypothetical protein
VNRVDFFGSYYEIEVLLVENIFTVKAIENNVVKGDTIYLTLDTDKVWYV